MSDDPIVIASDRLSAAIAPLGAELQWLRDGEGRELLWDGDPAVWAGRAPILFPVVGAVADGIIRVDGARHEMPKHGIARRRRFAVVETNASGALFRLDADEATRAAYPFDFRLDLHFTIEGATLTMVASILNRDRRPLPASFGFHPALRWPLPGGGSRAAHQLRFARPEPAPIRRIDADGLLSPILHPTPVRDDRLALDDSLFVDDALIFDRLESRSLVYGPEQGPRIVVETENLPHLGIWTKPGAGYVCIEPWQGHADPAGFAGAFEDKPGIVTLPPGQQRDFIMRLTWQAPPPPP